MHLLVNMIVMLNTSFRPEKTEKDLVDMGLESIIHLVERNEKLDAWQLRKEVTVIDLSPVDYESVYTVAKAASSDYIPPWFYWTGERHLE
jgi:hypothetical protein